MRIFFLLLFTAITLVTSAQSSDEAAIRQVLTRQAGAWNKGSIDSFMVGYWQSDSLLFIGKTGPTYGYESTLRNYKKGYADTAAMGKLTFHISELRRLSPQYYFVVGRFHLQRSIGNADGYFTLLFRRLNGQWVIVADHSSSAG